MLNRKLPWASPLESDISISAVALISKKPYATKNNHKKKKTHWERARRSKHALLKLKAVQEEHLQVDVLLFASVEVQVQEDQDQDQVHQDLVQDLVLVDLALIDERLAV